MKWNSFKMAPPSAPVVCLHNMRSHLFVQERSFKNDHLIVWLLILGFVRGRNNKLSFLFQFLWQKKSDCVRTFHFSTWRTSVSHIMFWCFFQLKIKCRFNLNWPEKGFYNKTGSRNRQNRQKLKVLKPAADGGGQVWTVGVKEGSCHVLLQPGEAGTCGRETRADCRSSPPLSGHHARCPPKTPDCRQSREPSAMPKMPGGVAPSNTCKSGEELLLV